MIRQQAIQAVHAAMESAGGSINKAAQLLGMKRDKLKEAILQDASLRSRWVKGAGEPDEAITLHRPALPVPDDEAAAKMLEEEDALVRRGLEGMGLSPRAQSTAVAAGRFQRQHYKSALQMITGGITKQFWDVSAEIDQITATLNVGGLDLERESELRKDRREMLAVQSSLFDRFMRAALTLAKIKAMQNQTQNGGGKMSRPAFTPLVAVQGTNVTITDKSDEK